MLENFGGRENSHLRGTPSLAELLPPQGLTATPGCCGQRINEKMKNTIGTLAEIALFAAVPPVAMYRLKPPRQGHAANGYGSAGGEFGKGFVYTGSCPGSCPPYRP